MSSKINLQTCEYACKSSIFQDNQLIYDKLEKAIRFAKLKVEKELVLQTEDRFLAEQDPEL